jgi:protease-4
MATDKSRSVVGIFILIFVLFVIFYDFCVLYNPSLKSTGKAGNSILFDKNKAPIAVIEVNGVIMDSKKTIELLHTAEKEESIKAIILRVDSPGGAVGPTQEIYEEILRIDKDKPVYSSFASVAASGGIMLEQRQERYILMREL